MKNVARKRLTDPVPEWEIAYVQHKIDPGSAGLCSRLFRFVENTLDGLLHPRGLHGTEALLACAGLLVDFDIAGRFVAVIGCGPQPAAVRDLANSGFVATGVEPVAQACQEARAYLSGTNAEIVAGTAEHVALDDKTQSFVLLENVLEHVDSVRVSLSEAYRILAPGGILFVRTTNRQRISLTGINWEFRTRFYNWFPRLVKESYVYDQLHCRPELACYSPRPAVHWFSYSELCEQGRDVGFARFYSPYDLLYQAQSTHIPTGMRHWFHRNPWLRALAVSQMHGDIFMWKRPEG